jgi:hypothetical protein
MAIQFTQSVDKDELLGAYDDHVVKYNSDSVKIAVKSDIVIDGKTFSITPDPNKQFTFNISEVVRVIMNQNRFKDSLVPNLSGNVYLYPDATLYKSVAVTYIVEFDDQTTEQTTVDYEYIKAVHQPENYLKERIDITTKNIAMLLPFIDDSIENYYTPYYYGFPFDIQIFSKTSTTLTLRNMLSSISVDVPVMKGVSRIFFSDGKNNSTLIGDLPITRGMNEIEISDTAGNKMYLLIERIDTCGNVFKYVNSKGGYSYNGFDKYQIERVKTKTGDTLQPDLNSIDHVVENSSITGKTSSIEKRFVKSQVSELQQKHFQEIFDSPLVYMYIGRGFEQMTVKHWFGVTVKDGTLETKGKRRINDRFMIINSIKKTQTQ